MAEPPDNPDDDGEGKMPMITPPHDPSKYTTQSSKERFAVAKYYGMGPDGEWTVEEIAEALDVSKRQVYRYLNESEIAQDVQDVLATTEAEWRLDAALNLRREVQRLEKIEQELLQRQKSVATEYETKTVQGTPTGDRNISLDENSQSYRLKMPVPADFETVTDYGTDLDRIIDQKRKYWDQISDLLGLDAVDKKEIDHSLASRHEEVKVVEIRESDDDYPEPEVIDMDAETVDDDSAEIEVEATEPSDDE